jgi:hypothetical protein
MPEAQRPSVHNARLSTDTVDTRLGLRGASSVIR